MTMMNINVNTTTEAEESEMLLKDKLDRRTMAIANYYVRNENVTVKDVARHFYLTESIVKRDMQVRLPLLSPILFEATKKKHTRIHQNNANRAREVWTNRRNGMTDSEFEQYRLGLTKYDDGRSNVVRMKRGSSRMA